MTIIKFTWPLAECINANRRLHWAVKARRIKALREAAYLHGQRLASGYDAAHLTITVGWPDNRRRDVANWHPTFKAAIDGFVDAGLLPDDDDKHLTGPDLRPIPNAAPKGHVALTFHFEPKEN